MQRYIYFLYGVVCYLLFHVTAAYMVGFVGDFLVPKSIDTTVDGPTGTALLVNLMLLGLFALPPHFPLQPKVWLGRLLGPTAV